MVYSPQPLGAVGDGSGVRVSVGLGVVVGVGVTVAISVGLKVGTKVSVHDTVMVGVLVTRDVRVSVVSTIGDSVKSLKLCVGVFNTVVVNIGVVV